MYSLNQPTSQVKGIGRKISAKLAQNQIKTVKDLLLYLPLRYDDLSQIAQIQDLEVGQTYTIKARLVTISEFFRSGRRMTSAVIADETGQTKAMWFNNRYIKNNLKKGEEYFFSGKYSKYRNLTQPQTEAVKSNTIHTGRLVPIYSSSIQIKQGRLRRILKQVIDNLKPIKDNLASQLNLINLNQTFKALHFPEEAERVVEARERLALEELLTLIEKSKKIKQNWNKQQPRIKLKQPKANLVPSNIPFELTQAQQRASKQIIQDLAQNNPMNRLLIGDVGSGKTVVAGIGAHHLIKAGSNVALIAPTQILAQQHYQTFNKIMPELKTQLLTAKTSQSFQPASQPSLYIGTHAVINQLDQIQPGLIIYDEQHRFGVKQRSVGLSNQQKTPHILTMTATPIPRSLMLTIFSHLEVSILDEMPFGPKPIKTWAVSEKKRKSGYEWIAQHLTDQQNSLAMVVCPFINPSDHEAFSQVRAAKDVYQELQKLLAGQIKSEKIKLALLHGQQKKNLQEKIISKLYQQKINLLVTTSIVEVGVDLPQADIMAIESAERFGLASLHQLRGRVGRQGQKSFCLLFNTSQSKQTQHRLKIFSQTTDGIKLAELDLKNRGAGDLFGLQQSGLDELQFASWTNLDLIQQAREAAAKIEQEKIKWLPIINTKATKQELKLKPAAN